MVNIKKGDVFYADLNPVVGSEQGGIRPVLVVQNDTGNRHSPTIIAAAITSRKKNPLPTHVEITHEIGGLPTDSIVLMEQVRTIDKRRLKEKVSHLSDSDMVKVDNALKKSFGIKN